MRMTAGIVAFSAIIVVMLPVGPPLWPLRYNTTTGQIKGDFLIFSLMSPEGSVPMCMMAQQEQLWLH